MTRSPLALAALASAAVRGLNPISSTAPDHDGGDFDVAFVDDDRGQRWVVRAPRRVNAALSIEAEARVLAELRRQLPVAVPEPVAFPLPEGGRAVIYPFLPGTVLHAAQLLPGPGLAVEIGRIIAALHEIPPERFDQAGVPTYSATEYRERRLAELDQAARSGHVPTRLMTRWEHALEDVGRWGFSSVPIHGDLAAEHILVDRAGPRGPDQARVSGVLDWAESRVADPADDLAWVVLGASPEALDTVLEAYAMGRREQPDRYLLERASLAGELALVRWLLSGVASDDQSVIDRAVWAMRDLDQRQGATTVPDHG